MASGNHSQRVLNPIPRRLLRRRISRAEVLAGCLVIGALLACGAWIASRAQAFDPADRDISFQALEKASVVDTLYQRPLRRWVEPGQQGAAAVDLGPFPASLLEGGWVLDGRVETYSPENLYVKINGAAEQYLAFGFQELTYLTLARDSLFLTVEIYDQGRPANALGLFAQQRDENARVLSEGDVHYTPTSVGALGMRGKLLFRVAASAPGPAVDAKTRQILALIAALDLPSAQAGEAGVEVLTRRLDLPFEAVAYQKENVFQYDFLEDFWFASGLDDFSAGADARAFLHLADDADQAADLYQRLLAEQLAEYERIEATANRVLLRHRYLGTIFALARDGARLYGAEHVATPAAARALLDRLEESADGP